MDRTIELATGPDARGTRLDRWLEAQLADFSRARLQALIRAGRVTLDGQPVKAHQRVRPGMHIALTLPPPTPSALVAQAMPLAILFEDDDLIVIAKPAGLVVHPAAGHPDGTLVNALLHHCRDLPGIGGEARPGIVHRLDRDTTGVLVAAKTETALAGLVAQFQAGTVDKEYLALVHGRPTPATGTIDTLIGRSAADRKKMSARPAHGRRAVTHYQVARRYGDWTLLRLRIDTGRTHQIRVHLAHIGHPVVGDPTYGRHRAVPGVSRQMLHAARLAFTHPRTGERLAFEAPLPPDFANLIEHRTDVQAEAQADARANARADV